MSNAIGALGPGFSINVAATGSNVQGTIDMKGGNALHIVNTSATLFASVAWGVGAQTAVLGTSLTLPPMGSIVVSAGPLTTGVSAIGSAAGPTAVIFTPVADF